MLDLLKDLWGFMRARKKFWLAPIILIMLVIGCVDCTNTRLSDSTFHIYLVLIAV